MRLRSFCQIKLPEDLMQTQRIIAEQQEAIGEEAIKQIKIVELIAASIQEGKIKIVPDVLVSGGGNAGDGLMGQLTRLLPGVDLNALVNKQAALPKA